MSRAESTARARLLALFVLTVLIASVAGVLGISSYGTGVRPLEGTWPATIQDGRTVVNRDLPFPARYDELGLAPDAVVTWRIPMRIDRAATASALYAPGGNYAIAMNWDGVPMGEIGKINPGSTAVPGGGPLLAEVPSGGNRVGKHLLIIRVQGTPFGSGVHGEVLWGQREAIRAHQGNHGFRDTVLAAVTAIAAIIVLIPASLRAGRQDLLWLGLIYAALAGWTFANSDFWWSLSQAPSTQVRASAVFVLLGGAAAARFAAEFGRRPPSRAVDAVVIGSLALSLAIAVFPDATLVARLRPALNGVLAVGCLAAATLLLQASRARVDGAWSVLMAGLVMGAAMLAEALAGHATSLSHSALAPSGVFFTGATAAAVVLRHTDAATRYELLFEQDREGILLIDAAGRVREANDAAKLLTGADPFGKPLESLVHADAKQVVRDYLQVSSAGRRAELTFTRDDGETLHVESASIGLPDNEVMLVLRDVTARRNVEQGLVSAARMETVGILARGIAHDFNNALGALLAHIGMLQVKVEGEKEQERLTRMEAVIRRAGQMSRRLLTLARGGSGTHVALDVAPTVHDAVELTRSMIPPNVEIRERFDPFLPRILAAPDELEQALLNLLVNAKDAVADRGGTITVETGPYSAQGIVTGVRISVIDDGPGIPAQLRERIFEPFFTTKGGRGTGLGLSVVHRIVREHDGLLGVLEGPNGKGTRFDLVFPTAESPDDTQEVSRPPGGARILVVDDDPDILDMMHRELQARSYTVEPANNPFAAQAAFINAEGNFDLLVTDVVMDGPSGIELARFLTLEKPRLRVLIVSGFIPEHEARIPSHWHSIPKPFTAEQLATAVRRALTAHVESPTVPPTATRPKPI